MPDDTDRTVRAEAVTLKIPPFWPQKVSLWFVQLEAQFTLGRITADATKLGYVIAHLDTRYLDEVEDIVKNPPEDDKYEAIKTRLIKRLTDSDSTRVRKLLESEEIGDRSPTQFYRHLKQLAGTSVNEDFLVEMWKNHLPKEIQLVLAATSDKDGAKLAEIADRVHDIPSGGRIAAVDASHLEIEKLYDELKQMRVQLNEMQPLNELLKGSKKGNTPVVWNINAEKAFVDLIN